MKLFISYSRADAQFVEQLVPLLTTAFRNYTIWYDKHIDGGEDWWQRILTEINACDVFIYLLSNDSIGSEYCQAECREALRLQKLILPVIVRPKTNVEAIPDDLKPEIKRRNWVNLPDGFGNAAANATLYGAIHSLAAQIPSQALEPLQPTPVTQPDVTRVLKQSKSGMAAGQSRNRTGLAAIGIGLVAVLAIVGAIILPSLNKSAAVPTLLPTNLTATNTALTINGNPE